MEDLTIECDTIKVRARTIPVTTVPSTLAIVGVASILGLLLIAATKTSVIPITTGILGGKPVIIRL